MLAFLSLALALQAEHAIFPAFDRPVTYGPKFTRIALRLPVKLKSSGVGTVTFPVPSDFEGQRVVSFEMRCSQPAALKGWKWVDRKDGINRLCEVKVAPQGKGAWVGYEAIVYTPGRQFKDPEHVDPKSWLKSSINVQADDPDIRSLAVNLAKEAKGEDELVKKTVLFVALNKGDKKSPFLRLDAKSSLKNPGSCTNHAQFCAALLRANGIPARCISHMPTWYSQGGKTGVLYEHWLTEYWSPTNGWSLVEPILGLAHPGRNTVIQLAVSSIDDENQGTGEVHERSSMPGSAYLSLAELSPELYSADVLPHPPEIGKDIADEFVDDAMNEVQELQTLPEGPYLQLLKAIEAQASRVRKAGLSGKNMKVATSVFAGKDAKDITAALG